MREIKYKGKRVDNGEWVYGYYYKREWSNPTHFIRVLKDKHFIDIAVKPETVGQYVGLQDKNKTEIYTGDEIAIFHKESEETPDEFRNVEAFRFVLEDIRDTYKKYGMRDNEYEQMFREVVGNKHEK